MKKLLGLGGLVMYLVGCVAMATPAAAAVQGPCVAEGVGSQSTTDLTSATVWHLHRGDHLDLTILTANEASPTMKWASGSFGVAVPITQVSGKQYLVQEDFGNASDIAPYARSFSLIAASSTCSATISVIIDDVPWVATLAGKIGLGLLIVGLLGMVGTVMMRRSAAALILGGLAGLVAGVGLGVVLQQTGTLDPANSLDITVPVAGIVVGVLLAGRRHRKTAEYAS